MSPNCLETLFAQRFLEPFWFLKSGRSGSSECDFWVSFSGRAVGAQFDILRRLPALVFEGVCACSGPPSERCPEKHFGHYFLEPFWLPESGRSGG